jgi:hypothetical protein
MATTERAALQELKAAQQELAAQPRARKKLIETFWAGALHDAVEESKAADSVDDLRQWTEVSGAVLSLLRRSDPALLDRLLDTLEQPGEGEPAPETLEAWGRVQVHATLGRVRDASHTVHWLEEHGVSRQRLNQWRRRGRALGIPDLPGVKGYAYPRWQFSDGLRPKPWLAPVLAAAEDARLDALGLHLFMTNPEAGDGRSPLEAADSGDVETTVALVAAANAQGA